jgi:competence protein ComEA
MADKRDVSSTNPGARSNKEPPGFRASKSPSIPDADQRAEAEIRHSRVTKPRPPGSEVPPEPLPQPEPAPFQLRPRDQLVVGSTVAVALLLMGIHWIRLSGWGLQPVEIDHHPTQRHEFQIDINTAGWVEWTQLRGIGQTLALRIVADRDQNGPFRSVDDLRRVKGIGPKTLARIRDSLTLDNPDDNGHFGPSETQQ